MRTFGLAAALTVLVVASVGGAAYLGMSLAGDARGETARPPAGHVVAAKHRRRADWGERAGAICGRGKQETKTAIEDALLSNQGGSQHEQILAALSAETRVDARVLARLRALRLPAGDRRAARRALRLMAREQGAHLRALASLRRRWDDALLNRQIRSDRELNGRIRLLFVQLGAFGCSSYLSD